MNTPTKYEDERAKTPGATTPFREQAMEERRLKDELLLSATPGLERRPKVYVDSRIDSHDPAEVKSYLRDLSDVLVLRDKRNLTDVLANEDRLIAEDSLEIAGDEPGSVAESVEEPESTLKETVFRNLESGKHRLKMRRVLEPLVIKDRDKTPETENTHLPELELEPEPVLEHVEDNYVVEEATPDVPERPEPVTIDDSSFTDSDPEEFEPLTTFQVKQCLRPIVEREEMELTKQSWTALQRASETLLRRIGKELLDEDNRIIPDRQNILQAFEKLKVVPKNSTNEALFEVCCKYLPLEDLNDLETSLFL